MAGKVFEDITATIGATPLVKIKRMGASDANILAKLESFNPCGSVKDRIAISMIEAAEKEGLLNHETIVIEPRTILKEQYVDKVIHTLNKRFREYGASEMSLLSFILL